MWLLCLCLMGSYDMIGPIPVEKVVPVVVDKSDNSGDIMKEEIITAANTDISGVSGEEELSDTISYEPVVIAEKKAPTPVIYLYVMSGCPPCERLHRELSAADLPYPLMIGQYPATFRDCTSVTRYPSLEIVEEDRVLRRFVGYVSYTQLQEAFDEIRAVRAVPSASESVGGP